MIYTSKPIEQIPDWHPLLPESKNVVHNMTYGSPINGKTLQSIITRTKELGYELAFEKIYMYRSQINETNEFVRMVQWSSDTFDRNGLLSHQPITNDSDTSGYLLDEFERYCLWLRPEDKLAFELKWIPVNAK